DFQSCLICIARRLPRPTPITSLESFVTKQDATGKIISIDTSTLRASGSTGWEDLVRKCIYAFFQAQGTEPSYAKQLFQEGFATILSSLDNRKHISWTNLLCVTMYQRR
ncbi:hypothetical protein GDO81_019584, partial [Engystomops pustulosus]